MDVQPFPKIGKLLICGGGNGTHALLTIAGKLSSCQTPFQIKIYTPFKDEAVRLTHIFKKTGGIQAVGTIKTRRHRPALTTSDPAEAATDVDMVLMVLPAFAHGMIIQQLAPYLKPGVVIGAMPARSGLEFQAAHILKQNGISSATIFGLQTLPWACRITDFGNEVEILGEKSRVGLAAVPANHAAETAAFLSRIIGIHLVPMDNMLALSLSNVGQIIHPGIMYGLFKRYQGESFPGDEIPLFYNGVTEEIAGVLQQMSDEVLLLTSILQEKLGKSTDLSEVISVKKWLMNAYEDQISDPGTLARAFQTNRAYQGLKAPMQQLNNHRYMPDFQSRYLTEELPTGLVVTAGLARLASNPLPVVEEVIRTTSVWTGKDYLTPDGFNGKDIGETRLPGNFGITDISELTEYIS